MKRLPKPPAPTDEDLNLTPLVDHDGIRCLPDAPRWWEDLLPEPVCRAVDVIREREAFSPKEWYHE